MERESERVLEKLNKDAKDRYFTERKTKSNETRC